jgi:hypothetical protein
LTSLPSDPIEAKHDLHEPTDVESVFRALSMDDEHEEGERPRNAVKQLNGVVTKNSILLLSYLRGKAEKQKMVFQACEAK